jgi:hypothetical protein
MSSKIRPDIEIIPESFTGKGSGMFMVPQSAQTLKRFQYEEEVVFILGQPHQVVKPPSVERHTPIERQPPPVWWPCP